MAHKFDSRETDTKNPDQLSIDSTHDKTVIEAAGGEVTNNFLDMLAFMEEEVVVTVMASHLASDEDPVPAGNNGQFVWFKRGVPTKCKRKFLDSLIVKNHAVSTPYHRTPDGEETRQIRLTNSAKYPFMVDDPNPRGKDWLRYRMAEII